MSEPKVQAHEVDWTPAKIERFWELWAAHLGNREFFSLDYGWAILDITERSVALRKRRVLDIGTGPGFLLDELIRRGAECLGVELSPTLTAMANERLGRSRGFGGVIQGSVEHLPVANASVDVAFSIEVIEHLLDNQLERHLAEMARVVRLGGHAVVSTPNEEDLGHSRTVCPDCGALFHRIQHVRRWSKDTIIEQMRLAGFEPERVVLTVLGRNRIHAFASRSKIRLRRVLHAGTAQLPQLVYVGRRAGAALDGPAQAKRMESATS